jgi:hypothetical protein
MAVKIDTTTIFSTNATAAKFRLWCVFIDTLFTTTGGWVDTAASGSIDFTTVAAPSGSLQSMGYKVYRMADTLQSTAPVFVKVEYGSNVTTMAGLWITIGTATDGAGNIIGTTVLARQQVAAPNSADLVQRCQGSADTNRICFAMFLSDASSLSSFWLSIERTKDSNGADTNVGVIVAWGSASTLHKSAYCPFVGILPPLVVGLHILISHLDTSSFDGDVGVSAMYPMGTQPKQPGLNVIAVRSTDFISFAGPIVQVYGTNHLYSHCGPNINTFRCKRGNGLSAGEGLDDSGVRLCLRYE